MLGAADAARSTTRGRRDPLEGLNPEQRAAVEHGEGPLLVLAGAGSGKTRALTHRVAQLVRSGRADPGELLAITFTNKAAGEMRERVGDLVGNAARRMWIMTFHSACARILRTDASRIGYTGRFTIYDEADSLRLIRQCMQELGLDRKRFAPRAIKAKISEAKNRLIDASRFGEHYRGSFDKTVAEVYRLYERRIHEMNAMDFDDLLFRTANLLELYEEVLRRYRRTFRWILVDEYQDTNHAQYRLLKLLAGEHRNLMVVGDDDQSIYGFRGADIRNILDFEKDFPDAVVVKLERNYRSTQTILSAANAIVAHNRERKPKALWTDASAGSAVKVRELEDEHAEARFVAGELERLAEEGIPRSEVAVFYRINAQSRVLEDTLVRYGIPYQVVGGTKFYERAEIKDAIAYLALIVNPRDAVAFQRIVNTPRRGIGRTTVARLLTHANTVGEGLDEVASHPEEVPGITPRAIKAVGRFMSFIEDLRDGFEQTSVADLLKRVLDKSGYVATLEAERTIEAQGRLENLKELVGVAMEYDQTAEVPTLAEFLQQVSLYTDQDSPAVDGESGVVTFMTLHNAKGLEFDAVLIVGCEEGVFPHSRAMDSGDLDEERRLCYVGMTRARRELYFTYARNRRLYGASGHNQVSRFVEQIPRELTDADEWPEAGGFGGRSAVEAGPAGGGPIPPVSIPFQVGDDVIHASFGEGVVLATEPGGIVVVRFAGDGSERKLTVDYAPLRRR